MPGPEELRLIQALNGAEPGRAGGGAREWEECAVVLEQVAQRLATVSMPIPLGEAGAQTAQAMDAAFARSATAMTERANKLRAGREALRQAETMMEDARTAREGLGAEGSGPGSFSSTHDPKSPEYITAKQHHDAEQAAFEAEQQRRERISKQWADQLDTTFKASADTMREIHGEPPPPPPPNDYEGSHGRVNAPTGSGGGGGGGTGGGGGGTPTGGGGGTGGGGNGGGGGGTGGGGGGGGNGGGGGGTPQGTPITTIEPPTTIGTTPNGSTGSGVSPGAGLGVAGAAGGAAAGGIIGAGLTAGGIRGGGTPAIVNPGTAAGGVRGIGSTSRTGMSGALGRPAGTPGVGAAGSGTAARSGSAARTGAGARSAASAGSRGGAGGRGAGGSGARGAAGRGAGSGAGGAAGRGGRGSDKERRGKDDPFEAPEDWVGEDEASPAILD